MPPKKPAARRHNRHTNDVGLVAVASSTAIDLPAPRSAWSAATKDEWSTFWTSPQAALVVDADRPAVVRLFAYRDELARSLRAFQKERFVDGSKGQPVLNPLADHVAKLERLIAPLEDRFGLTPLARLRLGVTFGDARRSLDDLFEDDQDDDDVDPRRQIVGSDIVNTEARDAG